MKKKLTDLDPNVLSSNLLQWHTIGGISDDGDLQNVLYHGANSIKFAIAVIKDYKGTTREKVEHLKKVAQDLEKFHVK